MAFVRLSGVTYLDPELAHDSYVLFTGADGITRVIDLNGTVVHESGRTPVCRPAFWIPRSTTGASATSGCNCPTAMTPAGGIYANGTVGQLDWDGDIVWEWGTRAPGGAARQNHDWELLPNGNRLILVTVPRIVAQAR